ncbi:MAG: preprotein translocase subunit SecA, partial [Dehalococcoidia bacterium]|nr:preprotein translocase subunit SecA [Dehalococcoidia bacterium]
MGLGKFLGRGLGGVFLDSNEKQLKRYHSLVESIKGREADVTDLSDDALRATTDTLKQRLASGESIDDVLVDAFTAVREMSRRTLGLRHFDVQLIGGIILHQGHIAEMKTGEGKTLMATLPLYLNALEGEGCHLVTVNDYLAKRDCLWMGPVYDGLGLSVACITGRQDDATQRPSFIYDPAHVASEERWSKLRPCTRAEAYAADITYGTNNEFGFDYLRDNMVNDLSQCVQRTIHYAIVDEVDNILIDEARTPLIISAASLEAANKYVIFDRVISKLSNVADYEIDERARSVHLTEDGTSRVEAMLHEQGVMKGPSLFDSSNYMLTHYLQSSLRAHALFRRDKDYVVKAGQVIIVDEFTGRLMPGRRYSEGLHQAIEAKEHVQIQHESVTHATITFQNYFRMYSKLAGMTGTAVTEAEEFSRIYKLEVLEVPTNKPNVRQDLPDRIYKDEKSKFMAVVNDVAEAHAMGRPVLVGTTSIETSETLSNLFVRRGLRAQVLNAKNHEREASIIAEAGHLGAITVATNMAGRGVDIILGGNPDTVDASAWQKEHDEVLEKGGLYVVGTEHHEARRIDNQLRGRSGRQGDPGSSRFFLSLQDDLLKFFAGDWLLKVLDWLGMEEGMAIEDKRISKGIERAQRKVEERNFGIRKNLLEYDEVMDYQR